MTNGRKASTSQQPRRRPTHLPKVGSARQTRWDRRQRLGDLEFDVAWVIGTIVIITMLTVLAFILR